MSILEKVVTIMANKKLVTNIFNFLLAVSEKEEELIAKFSKIYEKDDEKRSSPIEQLLLLAKRLLEIHDRTTFMSP